MIWERQDSISAFQVANADLDTWADGQGGYGDNQENGEDGDPNEESGRLLIQEIPITHPAAGVRQFLPNFEERRPLALC